MVQYYDVERKHNMRIRKKVNMFIAYIVAFAMIGSFMPDYRVDADEIKVSNDEVLTSEELLIEGYQIRARYDDNGEADISFRTIAVAPSIGETIEVDGKEYTVANMGTIYVLDPDCSGYSENRVLPKDYTVLDESTYTDDGSVQSYEGANHYQGKNWTYGFIATEAGYFNTTTSASGIEQTRYIRTMTKMNNLMANSIQTRAFVVATDGTIIYSDKAWTASIAKIADELYIKGMMPNAEGHDFIYDNILNSEALKNIYDENNEYPFYRTQEVEYGWSEIVKP